MGNIYDSIIDDLAKNDPEFLKLDQAQQDSLVENLAQEKYGKIPQSERVLQNASQHVKPFFEQSDVPQIVFQGAQGFIGNAPQNIAENPKMFAMGGIPSVQAKSGSNVLGGIQSLFGRKPVTSPETTEFSDKYMNPKSLGGKLLGGGLNFATGLYNPVKFGGPVVAKGLGKITDPFNPMSTSMKQTELPDTYARSMQTLKGMQADDLSSIEPKIERAKSIYDLIKGRKASSVSKKPEPYKVDKSAIDEIVFGGSEEIKNALKIKANEFNSKFGEGFEKLNSSMTKGDLADILDNVIQKLGVETQNIPGTSASKLRSYVNKLIPADSEGVLQIDPNEVLDPKTVQSATKAIRNLLGSDLDSSIKFNQSLLEKLPDTIPGLKELKADYAPKFEMVSGAKKYLTSGSLNKIASGSAGKTRLSKAEEYAEKIGSSAVKKAKDFSESSNRNSELAKKTIQDFELKQDEANIVGEKILSKIGEHLESLGDKKNEILSKHKTEAEDLMNLFRETREELSKEKIQKYKRLAIVASILSLMGVDKVRSVLKEKF